MIYIIILYTLVFNLFVLI